MCGLRSWWVGMCTRRWTVACELAAGKKKSSMCVVGRVGGDLYPGGRWNVGATKTVSVMHAWHGEVRGYIW